MSIEQKQEYLKTEIVEQGLDPHAFYEYWQSFNLQIQEAEMSVLMDIVRQFKQQNKKQPNHEDDDFGQFQQGQQQPSDFYKDMNWDFLSQPTKKEKQETLQKDFSIEKGEVLLSPEKLKQEERKVEKKGTGDVSLLDDSGEKKTEEPFLASKEMNITLKEVFDESNIVKKKCLKLQPNILHHHINVEIFIPKWEEVQDVSSNLINKLWKGKEILFTIKTVARNKQKVVGVSWEVKRKHSDFQWLRGMLCKFYPGLIVPPLPTPTKSEEKLAGYLRKLQSFLLDCYYCPELKNSKYLQVFLSYNSQSDFQIYKKNSENNTRPKSLGHILNMKGEVELMFGDKIQAYTEGLQSFLSTSSHHLKNVKSIILSINELYENIANKYRQLSEVFRIMSEESCSFSDEQCYPRLTETYKQIANLTDQHSDFCLNEKDFIETFMLSQFAYEKDRIDNVQHLIAKRKTFCSQLAKPKHQNEGQKESSSMFGKIASLFGEKSESLEIPSAQTEVLRQQVGFYNSQLMKESIRTVERMISSHVNHFSLYGHTRIDNVDAMQKIWSQVMVQLSKLHLR